MSFLMEKDTDMAFFKGRTIHISVRARSLEFLTIIKKDLLSTLKQFCLGCKLHTFSTLKLR